MNTEKEKLENALLEKIKKYCSEVKFDFSNYYFKTKLPKKEYMEKFKTIPAGMNFAGKRKYPVYKNVTTGRITQKLNNEDAIIVDVKSSRPIYYEIRYVSELNCVAILSWYVNYSNCTITKDDIYIIDSQKNVITKFGYRNEYKIYDSKTFAKEIEYICTGTCLAISETKMYKKAFEPLFPIAFLGGNNYTLIRNVWNLTAFLSQKEVTKRNGPKQERIDELCKIKLPEPKINYDVEQSPSGYWWNRKNVVAVASRVDENMTCLRWFKNDVEEKQSYETARLFVSKKEVTFCRINSFGEFIYINGKLDMHHFFANDFIIESDDVFKGTMLEYFESASKEVDENKRILLLWLFSYYPIAEKMWKVENFKYIPYNFITNQSWGNFSNTLTAKFGKININAKTLYKALGINSYQASKLQEPKKNHYGASAIKIIKEVLNTDDISSIDNASFDALRNLADNVSTYRTSHVCKLIVDRYSFKTLVRVASDFEKIKAYNMFNFYSDYLSMVERINDFENFRPFFRTEDDIKKMHDAAMVVYELKRNAVKQEAFNSCSKKWKKWEYKENEKFATIAPVLPSDLAKEGTTLHHCVRSYIDRVAEGRTNIMFIRKKEDLSEPFFTVEVSNDGFIEQVHGFGNRNANTEPGLEDYLKEWMKKCNLQSRSYNKIR